MLPEDDRMIETCRSVLNVLMYGLDFLNNIYIHMCVCVCVCVCVLWAGHVARMGEERGVYRVLVGKPEGKRPLGRPRRR